MTTAIRYCVRCTHPNTRPRITFTPDGVCNGCVRTEEKRLIDWKAKEQELRDLVADALRRSPDREYDCVVPVSGGKDSHYQTWYAVSTLGLRPLCVNIQPFLPTEIGARNLRNIVERLDVDLLSVFPRQSVLSRLVKHFFVMHGDPYPPILYLLFSHIARIALQKRIPVILYGENGDREYGGSNDAEFTELDNQGVHGRIRTGHVSFLLPREWTSLGPAPEDVAIYQEPRDDEMRAGGVQRLFFSDYVPWNNNHHLYVALNVIGGFSLRDQRSTGTFTFGSNTDDDLYEIYIWLLWPKFGFCRATKHTSKDIQEGKITRPRAVEPVRKYDGEFPWHALDRFCQKAGIKEHEFWTSVAGFVGDEENLARIPPHKGWPNHVPAWRRLSANRWQHTGTIHGEERILELPPRQP